MLCSWPQVNPQQIDDAAEEQMGIVMEIIRTIRNMRAEMNIKNTKKFDMIICDESGSLLSSLEAARAYIERFANTQNLTITDNPEAPAKSKALAVANLRIYIPLDELIDFDAEIKRLEAEKEKWQAEVQRANGKLANESFVAKAPAHLVEQERAKLQKYKDSLAAVEKQIEAIKAMA